MDVIGVTKTENQERISFFIYDIDKSIFKYQEVRGLSFENAYVLSVIANDINEDNFMDLIIIVEYKSTNNTETQVVLYDEATKYYKKVYTLNENNGGLFLADLGETRGYLNIK